MSGKYGRLALLGSALMLIVSSSFISGCSRNSASVDYLKGLQRTAVQGSLARLGNVDAAQQCPTCNESELGAARAIIAAEKGMAGGCHGLPTAESNYRFLEQSFGQGGLPAEPAYQDFIQRRTCVVASKYQECTDPGHRRLSIADESSPAGALVTVIDVCRNYNPLEADEILDRAIAREADAISFDILASDWKHVQPELNVYEALPRSNKERLAQWRSAIDKEETAESKPPAGFERAGETHSAR